MEVLSRPVFLLFGASLVSWVQCLCEKNKCEPSLIGSDSARRELFEPGFVAPAEVVGKLTTVHHRRGLGTMERELTLRSEFVVFSWLHLSFIFLSILRFLLSFRVYIKMFSFMSCSAKRCWSNIQISRKLPVLIRFRAD